MAVAAIPFITEDEYLDLEEDAEARHEYLAGQIYAMAGASPEHALIAASVGRELGNLAGTGSCRVYSADLRIRVEGSGLNTYPDVTVVCGEPRLTGRPPRACTNPSVIVEVLSESTQGYDRGEKWRHYQMIESLSDYLLVWQDRPRVEHYSRLPEGAWKYLLTEGTDSSVRVGVLNGELLLAGVYRGVEFPELPILREEYGAG